MKYKRKIKGHGIRRRRSYINKKKQKSLIKHLNSKLLNRRKKILF